jgi:hypothetical protein
MFTYEALNRVMGSFAKYKNENMDKYTEKLCARASRLSSNFFTSSSNPFNILPHHRLCHYYSYFFMSTTSENFASKQQQ